MYLPSEGLFAEALALPGLAEELQLKFRVCVAGPTTLAALVNSLQPVSYTHLCENNPEQIMKFNPDLVILTEGRANELADTLDSVGVKTCVSVSYTHLDVYKRQYQYCYQADSANFRKCRLRQQRQASGYIECKRR